MILTLKVTCVLGMYFPTDCIRVIEMDSEGSLLALHDAIQDAVGFDRDHLFEFIVGRNHRNRKVVFAEDAANWEEAVDVYAETTLAQIYPLPSDCRLFYHFDFGDDWYFEIRKLRKPPFEPVPGVRYPRVTDRIGPNPEQYPRDE
ncbi:MAG: hypothetical protein NTZ09_04575 [Candidatus Hydrogenedentes bacterium]|nr:hypothetical protein [Candidatus Hydrogenedentota bacterium]